VQAYRLLVTYTHLFAIACINCLVNFAVCKKKIASKIACYTSGPFPTQSNRVGLCGESVGAVIKAKIQMAKLAKKNAAMLLKACQL
jgi:hypothetical protein